MVRHRRVVAGAHTRTPSLTAVVLGTLEKWYKLGGRKERRVPDVKIAPSVLAADFSKLGEAVREAERAGADLIHVDVMDGHFVPNITIGPDVVAAIKSTTSLPLEVHLMISDPEFFLDEFVNAGASALSVHAEATSHLHRVVCKARSHPALDVGVAVNPATPLVSLEYVLSEIDFVLVMSVDPGFGGQQFIPASTAKIAALRRVLDERNLDVSIVVDGGINGENAGTVAAAGADILVAGASVFGQKDVAKAIASIRQAASESR